MKVMRPGAEHEHLARRSLRGETRVYAVRSRNLNLQGRLLYLNICATCTGSRVAGLCCAGHRHRARSSTHFPSPSLIDAAMSDAAASHIQSAARSRRVRRAAKIFASLPADLKALTVSFCESPVAMLQLDISWERMVAARFSQCGAQISDGDDLLALSWMPRDWTQHLRELGDAYELATVHHSELAIESVRAYLCASQLYTAYCSTHTPHWAECRHAMRAFARIVVVTEAKRNGAAFDEAWLEPGRVVEAAVMAVGA